MKSVKELKDTIEGLENRLRRLQKERPMQASGEIDVINKELNRYRSALLNIVMLSNDIEKFKTNVECRNAMMPYAEIIVEYVDTGITSKEDIIADILGDL